MKLVVKQPMGDSLEIVVQPQETIRDLRERLAILGVSLKTDGTDFNDDEKVIDLMPRGLVEPSVHCAVPGCGNTKSKDPDKVFFQFPEEPIRCHQWVLYCQRFDTDPGKKRLTLTQESTICSDHFQPDQFVKNTNTLLKRTAVPCVVHFQHPFNHNDVKGPDAGSQKKTNLIEKNQDSCSILCRLCAKQCTDFCFIFDENGKKMRLSEKINLCFPFSVKPSDSLPKQICMPCLEHLDHLYKMADLCSITHYHLLDLYSSGFDNCEPENSPEDVISKCPLCVSGDLQTLTSEPQKCMETDGSSVTPPPEFSENIISQTIKSEQETLSPYPDTLNQIFIKCYNNEIDNTTFMNSEITWQVTDIDSLQSGIEVSNKQLSGNMQQLGIKENSWINENQVSNSLPNLDNTHSDNSDTTISNDSNVPQSTNNLMYSVSCRICGFEFKDKEKLLNHSFAHSCMYFYQCAACIAFFTQKNDFNLHLSSHLEERYNCNVCQKQFNSLYSLEIHLCKPTECPICLKICANELQFSSHTKSHQNSATYCELCCKYFDDGAKLQKHFLYTHNAKKSHCCEECGKVFKSEASMKYHQRIHQTNEKFKPYTCEWCGKYFIRRSMLINHMSATHQHSALKVTCFTCTLCNEVFPDSNSSWIHLKNNHKVESLNESSYCFEVSEMKKILICEFCERCFAGENCLNLHRDQHPTDFPFECKFCGGHYSSRENYETHQKLHLNGVNIPNEYLSDFAIAKSYMCEFCERSFINYTKYKEHLSIHYGPEPYECRHCALTFSSLVEAMEHRSQFNIIPSSPENFDNFRPYQCHYCSKSFAIEDALIKHIRMHTGEKPFICDQCGKGFSQSSGLYTHQKVHSSARPYSCSLCPRTFKIKGDRDVHVRKHSGERPYKCEFCGKAFMTQHVYSQHRKIHTGERPYRCDVCGIAFRRSHVLTVHKRIHTGEKPNVCQFCGKRYRQKGDMLKHCRVQHGIINKKQTLF